MSETVKPWLRDFVVALITAITTITGSYFVFAGNAKKADAEMVATLYAQVQKLQEKVFEQQAELVSLKIKLSQKYEQSSVLKNYLDAMPYPAWIKLAEGDSANTQFTNWHINKAYEAFFKINEAFYKGKTDYEVWPEEPAKAFYFEDLKVFRRFAHRCDKETIPDRVFESSKNITAFVCRWPLEVDGKKAIAGQILLNDLQKGKDQK